MQVQENISLKPYNTFHIDATARYFGVFDSMETLEEMKANTPTTSFLLLGGGSNVLLTGDYGGLVLKNGIRGIEKTGEDDDYVYIRSGAGESWHGFVEHCIRNNWAGVENLSLIPGCVGTSPMQNIGAYGVEIKNVFHSLEALDLIDGGVRHFSLEECEFGYRESVFKHRYKGRYAILYVTYRLRKQPEFHTAYGDIVKELEGMGVKELSIAAVSEAVVRIRTYKLPNPALIGNAGSFFKNPSVSKSRYDELKYRFPDLVGYQNADGSMKLQGGWLIEQCGPQQGVSWKGYRRGDAGCHARQALVLVNYGQSTGKEIYELSEEILQSVLDKFGVQLEREVNVVLDVKQ